MAAPLGRRLDAYVDPSRVSLDRQRVSSGLTTWRVERKLNQTQLARYLGVSQRAVSKWELGGFDPHREGLLRLALAHYDCEHAKGTLNDAGD